MPKNRGGRDLVRPYGPSAIKMPNKEEQILMEDAEVLFLNFSGNPSEYNAEGQRNFCVILDPEVAEDMAEAGWNVKQLKEYQGEPGDYYIQVEVKYRDRFGKPLRQLPKLKLITSRGPLMLGEEDAHWLDEVDIAKVDMIVNGRVRYEDGVRKVKGYLQTYFCTVNEDYLEQKYAGMEDGDPDARKQFEDTREAIAELEAAHQDATAGMDIVDAEIVEEDE